MGSTRVPRRAGSRPAMAATVRSTADTAASVTGSWAETPKYQPWGTLRRAEQGARMGT